MFLVSICRRGILEPAVELRHLRYFVAVAEMENVSRAALKLHVSQPALSRQIRDLEDEIGFSLLERTAKSVRLTDAGRAFLDICVGGYRGNTARNGGAVCHRPTAALKSLLLRPERPFKNAFGKLAPIIRTFARS